MREMPRASEGLPRLLELRQLRSFRREVLRQVWVSAGRSTGGALVVGDGTKEHPGKGRDMSKIFTETLRGTVDGKPAEIAFSYSDEAMADCRRQGQSAHMILMQARKLLYDKAKETGMTDGVLEFTDRDTKEQTMLKIIHVDPAVLRENQATGRNDPAVVVHFGSDADVRRCRGVHAVGVFTLVQDSRNRLNGASAWIETRGTVVLLDEVLTTHAGIPGRWPEPMDATDNPSVAGAFACIDEDFANNGISPFPPDIADGTYVPDPDPAPDTTL